MSVDRIQLVHCFSLVRSSEAPIVGKLPGVCHRGISDVPRSHPTQLQMAEPSTRSTVVLENSPDSDHTRLRRAVPVTPWMLKMHDEWSVRLR